MKSLILFLALLCTSGSIFSQSFMHGVGLTLLVSTSPGENASVAEGFTYSPRFNFIENEKLSMSVGIPLTVAISASLNTNAYSTNSIGIVVNAPLIVNLNMGRGSTKQNRDKFGYFVGAGMGFHRGDFIVDDFYGGTMTSSINAFGPAGNAGLRFGVGKKHRNIELRFSFMKALNETKPSIIGVGGVFNF